MRVPLQFIFASVKEDNPNRFDTALIRHVIMQLLKSMCPPYSDEFVSTMIDILLTDRCVI